MVASWVRKISWSKGIEKSGKGRLALHALCRFGSLKIIGLAPLRGLRVAKRKKGEILIRLAPTAFYIVIARVVQKASDRANKFRPLGVAARRGFLLRRKPL